MNALEQSLRTHPGRCQGCGSHIQTQGHSRACIGDIKAVALAGVNDNAPTDVKARVDSAILLLARTVPEFSANDLRRELVDVPGPLVGGRFNALAKRGLIVPTGDRVPSNLGSTHGHELKVWKAAA